MGLPREITTSMVRFSFFKQNSEEDVNRVIEVLPGLVEKVRRLSAALEE
jgi:cysteine desulfurase